MVYWVIAKESPLAADRSAPARTVERLGPFESRDVAAQAREAAAGRYRGKPQARIEIVCEKGTAFILGTELKVAFHDGRVVEIARDPNEGGTGADPMAFAHDQHRAVIADFLDAIDNKRDPAISGREALRVHRLIDALLQSAVSGKTVKVA